MTVIKTTKIAPPNSQVVIVDPKAKHVDVPQWQELAPFIATSSCILVLCYPEVEGETEIALGNAREVDPGSTPIFDGLLLTPSRILAIETVEGEPIFEMPTADVQTKLRIWSDAIKWPTKIMVGIE
jgi:hypothetical protein